MEKYYEYNYYLYCHIRLDTNEVFYIGVGKQRSKYYKYYRAYSKYNRNKYWKNIVNKNNNIFIVEILLESNDESFIRNSEIEYIKKFRKISDEGTLCNITNGGESFNKKPYFKLSTKIRKKAIYTEEAKNAIINSRAIKIVQLDLNGSFIKIHNSITEAAKFINHKSLGGIKSVLNGVNKTAGGFIFIKLQEYNQNNDYSTTKGQGKKVIQLDKNRNFIKEWDSALSASTELNICYVCIKDVARHQNKKWKIGGYYWIYSDLLTKEQIKNLKNE